jgi:hypothetical protein
VGRGKRGLWKGRLKGRKERFGMSVTGAKKRDGEEKGLGIGKRKIVREKRLEEKKKGGKKELKRKGRGGVESKFGGGLGR